MVQTEIFSGKDGLANLKEIYKKQKKIISCKSSSLWRRKEVLSCSFQKERFFPKLSVAFLLPKDTVWRIYSTSPGFSSVSLKHKEKRWAPKEDIGKFSDNGVAKLHHVVWAHNLKKTRKTTLTSNRIEHNFY